MPAKPKPFVRPLPDSLVRALTRKASLIEKNLGKMPNVDHRKDWRIRRILNLGIKINPEDVNRSGGRVRQMDVSKDYLGTELIIKRVHDSTAGKLIKSIKRKSGKA